VHHVSYVNLPLTWVRWAYRFDAGPDEYTMRLCATDGVGQVMDKQERQSLPKSTIGWPKRTFAVEG
jgi:hypothetical protein